MRKAEVSFELIGKWCFKWDDFHGLGAAEHSKSMHARCSAFDLPLTLLLAALPCRLFLPGRATAVAELEATPAGQEPGKCPCFSDVNVQKEALLLSGPAHLAKAALDLG